MQVRDAFHDVVKALEDRERIKMEAEGYREDVLPKRGVKPSRRFAKQKHIKLSG